MVAGSARYFQTSEKKRVSLGEERSSVGNARMTRRKLDRECEAAAALEERVQLKRGAKDVASILVSNHVLMRKVKQVT